jgi:hypothetical protein
MLALAGCGGEGPKEMPKVTPEQTADQKKAHDEAVKGMQPQPPGGAAPEAGK